MQEKIYKLLKELIAIRSISCVTGETEASKFIYDYFKGMPYFLEHPDFARMYPVPGDALGRTVPYALIKGNSAKTVVILSLIHISEPTRRTPISYAVFCLK